MSIKQITKVLDDAVVSSRAELLVLIALADCANDEDGWCWPSIQYLAQRARCSYRQAHRIVIRLEKQGKITVQKKRGRNNTNRYKLNLTPCPILFELKPDNTVQENQTNEPLKSDIIVSDEPSGTTKTRTVKTYKQPFQVPGWVPLQDWNDWLEVRRKKRVPETDRALQLAVNRLTEFQNRGHPPGKVLQLAIERGWTGLFEPREQVTNGNGICKTEQDSRDGTAAAVAAGVDKFLRGKNALGAGHVSTATSSNPRNPS